MINEVTGIKVAAIIILFSNVVLQRCGLAKIAKLALAPVLPKNVGMVKVRMGNDTEPKWAADTESDSTCYKIVWRYTSSPVWTKVQLIGNFNNFVMRDMSKVIFFFASAVSTKQVIKAR